MSTEINITIGPLGLPTLSKEQREADRAKKLDLDEQKKTEENARIASNKQLKKFGFSLVPGGSLVPGALPSDLPGVRKHHKPKVNFLKLDPAASRRPSQVVIGNYYYQILVSGLVSATPPDPIFTTVIWSGDGLQSVEIPGRDLDFYRWDFAFPAGGDRVIWLAGIPTAPGWKAFYLDHTSIREITAPSGLPPTGRPENWNYLYHYNLGWAQYSAPQEVSAGIDPEAFEPLTTPSNFFLSKSLYPGLPTISTNVQTASSFRLLMPESADVKEILIVTNDDVDPYLNSPPFLRKVFPVGYQWNGPDPDRFAPDPGSYNVPLTSPGWQQINIVAPPDSFVPVNPYVASPLNSVIRGYVWDWNKPDFCRSQLLAIGFAEADLLPLP